MFLQNLMMEIDNVYNKCKTVEGIDNVALIMIEYIKMQKEMHKICLKKKILK